MPILDVVVVDDLAQRIARDKRPKLDGEVSLGGHVRAARLPDDLGRRIIAACTPQAVRDAAASANLGLPSEELFSFVSSVEGMGVANAQGVLWDIDNALLRCVALSRIVRPTLVGLRFAARVGTGSDGRWSLIHQHVAPGPWSSAWPGPEHDWEHGDWFDADDLRELGRVMSAVNALGWDKVPLRIRRAARFYDLANCAAEADEHTVLVAAAWDSLVSIDDKTEHKWQFVRRASDIARMTGATVPNEDTLQDWHTVRNSAVHGKLLFSGITARCNGDPDKGLERGRAAARDVERALRDILKTLLLKPELQSAFASDDALAAEYPVRKP